MEPDMTEQILQPISTKELERRWAETRKAMVSQGIDCLVMQNSHQWLGGYTRWFTDIPPEWGYPNTLIFPVADEMTHITSGARKGEPQLPPGAARGIGRIAMAPYLISMNYTNTMDAELAVEDLRARNAQKVGLVGKAFIPLSFAEYLFAHLEGVEFVDATDMVDGIKAIKSDEEIELLRNTAAVQDASWSAIQEYLRPGKTEYQIRAELQRILVEMGSEEQLIRIGSGPATSAAGTKSAFFQNRTLRAGDQVSMLIEVNGPGGLYTELSRTACLGTVPDELGKAWADAVEAQRRTVARMVAGALPADLWRAHNDCMVSMGYPPEGRLFAHGQGYDLVERPALRDDEGMILANRMNIAVHPLVRSAKATLMPCDNYLIWESGAEHLHKTPLRIFEV